MLDFWIWRKRKTNIKIRSNFRNERKEGCKLRYHKAKQRFIATKILQDNRTQ